MKYTHEVFYGLISIKKAGMVKAIIKLFPKEHTHVHAGTDICIYIYIYIHTHTYNFIKW